MALLKCLGNEFDTIKIDDVNLPSLITIQEIVCVMNWMVKAEPEYEQHWVNGRMGFPLKQLPMLLIRVMAWVMGTGASWQRLSYNDSHNKTVIKSNGKAGQVREYPCMLQGTPLLSTSVVRSRESTSVFSHGITLPNWNSAIVLGSFST